MHKLVSTGSALAVAILAGCASVAQSQPSSDGEYIVLGWGNQDPQAQPISEFCASAHAGIFERQHIDGSSDYPTEFSVPQGYKLVVKDAEWRVGAYGGSGHDRNTPYQFSLVAYQSGGLVTNSWPVLQAAPRVILGNEI